MTRVLIERWLADGMEEKYHAALRQMRHHAIHQPGYVSGETLRDVANPRHYVIISTWRSRRDWSAWERSEHRKGTMAQIAPMLAEPEKLTVFELA